MTAPRTSRLLLLAGLAACVLVLVGAWRARAGSDGQLVIKTRDQATTVTAQDIRDGANQGPRTYTREDGSRERVPKTGKAITLPALAGLPKLKGQKLNYLKVTKRGVVYYVPINSAGSGNPPIVFLQDGNLTLLVPSGPGGTTLELGPLQTLRLTASAGPAYKVAVTASPSRARVGDQVELRAKVSGGSARGARYAWSYSDGGTGSKPVVTHTLTKRATFRAAVTVTNAGNDGAGQGGVMVAVAKAKKDPATPGSKGTPTPSSGPSGVPNPSGLTPDPGPPPSTPLPPGGGNLGTLGPGPDSSPTSPPLPTTPSVPTTPPLPNSPNPALPTTPPPGAHGGGVVGEQVNGLLVGAPPSPRAAGAPGFVPPGSTVVPPLAKPPKVSAASLPLGVLVALALVGAGALGERRPSWLTRRLPRLRLRLRPGAST